MTTNECYYRNESKSISSYIDIELFHWFRYGFRYSYHRCYIENVTWRYIFQICKIAEKNPEVEFLQVNYEEQRSLCQSLHVHVLPFFRFYRGSSGRVCSFSCTNATVHAILFISFYINNLKRDCSFAFAFASMLIYNST